MGMKPPHSEAGHEEGSGSGSPCHGRPSPFWTTCRGRQAYRIGANWLGDILDPVSPERAVIEVELVADLVVNRLRNADGAGLGECLEPDGDINAIAKDVV